MSRCRTAQRWMHADRSFGILVASASVIVLNGIGAARTVTCGVTLAAGLEVRP